MCTGEPTCGVIAPEDAKQHWPDLPHTPRPEPAPGYSHEEWEQEYEDWGNVKCKGGQGYFCKQHAKWISCSEIEEGASPKGKESQFSCPPSHYQEEEPQPMTDPWNTGTHLESYNQVSDPVVDAVTRDISGLRITKDEYGYDPYSVPVQANTWDYSASLDDASVHQAQHSYNQGEGEIETLNTIDPQISSGVTTELEQKGKEKGKGKAQTSTQEAKPLPISERYQNEDTNTSMPYTNPDPSGYYEEATFPEPYGVVFSPTNEDAYGDSVWPPFQGSYANPEYREEDYDKEDEFKAPSRGTRYTQDDFQQGDALSAQETASGSQQMGPTEEPANQKKRKDHKKKKRHRDHRH